MKPVFLSASIPDPRRHPRYFKTADRTAIREAVIGLATVVLPHTELVFGGHPTISPLVRYVADRLGRTEHVVIYQSDFFRASVPEDSLHFKKLVWTDLGQDRDESLKMMRERMINRESHDFGAAVFVGGMEGIEDEFKLFRDRLETASVFPVASTGGASLILWKKYATDLGLDASKHSALMHDLKYASLFTRLLA